MSRTTMILMAILTTALTMPLIADDIAVKKIVGVSVIRCKIRYEDKYIEAHILFDVGLRTPMVIHEKSVGGFGLNPVWFQNSAACPVLCHEGLT